ncbi:MAG TPA: PAS domain-containing sensor histidine kinase [Candidatus Saccharimonadales bacterium]|nr:PAS domain-containing sensor histidine kinase [Candidatus Saccharimonadales bacterium]
MSDKNHLQNAKKQLINQDTRITALKKQLVYYQEITETVREPFIILDNNLIVVTANAAFYSKFEVKPRDTERKRIYDLGNSQWNSPDLRELLENILPAHRVLTNYVVKHNFPKLGLRVILLNARQVDRKQLILLALEDVTDEWRLKLDTEEMTNNIILQRDKLQMLNDAKEEFISLASHQLRTPATIVKQYVGMLQNGFAGKLTIEQLDMLGVAYKSNERQLEIIEDLLRVAKVDAGKVYADKSYCDVTESIEQAIVSQTVLFSARDQTIIFKKPSTLMMATIDPKLLLMVFENLLDNAGKYSEDGKQISISIRHEKTHIIVAIEDQGVGISQADLKKLFKKFSRIDNPLSKSVKGTGLGLYWAKKVIDLHAGTIKATSKINEGTVFVITLPTDDELKSKKKSVYQAA